MKSIRLYIADLAVYNRGTLQGEWIHVHEDDTTEDLRDRIQRHLDEWGAEEYAIHDYEGLPGAIYSEYMDLERVIDYKDLLNDFSREVVEGYFETPYWREADNWTYDIDSRFRGSFSSKEEWAHQHAEMCGWMEQTPETVQRYIDFEAFARDCELNGEIDFVELGLNTVVVFDAF